MSEKKSKTYAAEFKESAVKLAVESSQPATETVRDLGVNINTLHTWIANIIDPRLLVTLRRMMSMYTMNLNVCAKRL